MVENRPFLTILAHLILILGVAIIAFPVWMTFVASTHDATTMLRSPVPLLPGPHLIENYATVLGEGMGRASRVPIWRVLMNSLIMALGVCIGKIVISILAAYAVVYFKFPFRMTFFWMIFITLMLPVEVRIVPTYQVVASLDMLNSYSGLIIPLIASATATFLFRQFFLSVPEELAEAARVDGAGPVRFFRDILLPMSRTSIAALFVIQFIYGWNQYLWPLLMTTKESFYTVVMTVSRQANFQDGVPQWNLIMAVGLLAMLPPIVVVMVMQRQFVRGLVDTEKSGEEPAMAQVSLRKVHKSYGDTAVIHGIDMEVADGEFIVIVGPSGCGKSTLLRMVAGLELISAGECAIGGRVVNRLEPKDRDIAMVFQNYALYPHMSVYENMSYGLRLRGMRKDDIDLRVKKAAQTLQLGPFLQRKPRQLSGGQRQRVAMGRAIVREPAVFLFDEPLSNLDAKLRVQMRLEIKKLQRQLGTTSIYVTHDQVEAMTLADRLIVMNAGVAEQIGTPMEIYDRPATVFVAGFIGSPSMNFLPGVMSADGKAVALGEGGAQALPIAVALLQVAGQKVPQVGIRPEHLVAAEAGAQHVDLRVDMVEPLGADTLLHGRFVAAEADVTVSLPGHVQLASGSVLPLTAEPDRVHIFDRDSGKRIG